MIVVIADDLSGAAELANVAVECGLTAEVQMHFDASSSADVVCVDTETRSLSPERAAAAAAAVAASVATAGAQWCFKKCDSVLRGNVADEALAVARTLGKTRVLLVPANPSRRRIIRGGEYFVDGVPLSESPVGQEGTYQRRTSNVDVLLGGARGIEHPDVLSYEDVVRHARSMDAGTLPVGAADFFRAFVKRASTGVATPRGAGSAITTAAPVLFVCGSHTAWRMGRRDEMTASGIPVCAMPSELTAHEADELALRAWAHSAADALSECGTAALAIGEARVAPGVPPAMLAERLVGAVVLVLAQRTVERLYVEGGDTAAALISALGLGRFRAERSPGAGVGALRPADGRGPLLLIKPGSYPWPAGVMSQ